MAFLVVLLAAVVVAAPAGAGGAVRPLPPCRDRAYNLSSSKWIGPMRWWFRASSTPKGVPRSSAQAALRRAASNIASGRNNCGLPDHISATQRFIGRTSRATDVTDSGTCGPPDGRSVVGFGSLPSGFLALTCWWIRDGHTVEADIKLNKATFRWVPVARRGCVLNWSIEAVATHEFGHAFGLAHVYGTVNDRLTMDPLIAPCQNSQATLGLGDVRGLQAKY